MTFDWLGFLRHYGIPHWTEGKNVARGHVSVRCPYCGNADPSHHMGIELATGKWGCLRDAMHRGANPARLMVALAPSLTWSQAIEMVKSADLILGESVTWAELEERADVKPAALSKVEPIAALETFKPLKQGGVRGKLFDYLVQRKGGFDADDLPAIVEQYDIRGCLTGEWANRVILPIIRRRRWVGWQGRSIFRNAVYRYMSHPGSEQVKKVLFNEDAALAGGLAWVLVEGPLDAVKCDFYGKPLGVRFSGMMTTSLTPAQIAVVCRYASRFDGLYVLTDPTALAQALALQSQLAVAKARVVTDPPDAEDPGAYSPRQVRQLCRMLTRSAAIG